MTGILLVDKPAGLTSHDVVDRIRRAAGLRRVGHTGTLDPLATGLLILCLGSATRLSEFLTGLDKVYAGTMRLGVETDSHDLDGKVVAELPVPALSVSEVEKAFQALTGALRQLPPMVSAVKVKGERLYKLARKGVTVDREPRPITVREFTLLGLELPLVHFRVSCTRGTYVRSLCHEAGKSLGCGAALASLRRTSVGPHSVEHALPVDAFTGPEIVRQRLVPLEKALDMPSVTARRGCRKLVTAGNILRRDDLKEECPVRGGWVQVRAETGELLALAEVHDGVTGLQVQPKRVFTGPS